MSTSHLLSGITVLEGSPTTPSSIPQRLLRVCQFFASTISLGLFSTRLSTILSLSNQVTAAQGAVQGLLAAAVFYSISAILVTFFAKVRRYCFRRALLPLDIFFFGAFIAVAVLTRPNGNGSAGPRGQSCQRTRLQPINPKELHCNLPYGTFSLALLSVILHVATALSQYYPRGHGAMKTPEVREERVPLPKGYIRGSMPIQKDDNEDQREHTDNTRIGYNQKHIRTDSGISHTNSPTAGIEKRIENRLIYDTENDDPQSTAALELAGAAAVSYRASLSRQSFIYLNGSQRRWTSTEQMRQRNSRSSRDLIRENPGEMSDQSTVISSGAIVVVNSPFSNPPGRDNSQGLVTKEVKFDTDKAILKKKSLPGPSDRLIESSAVGGNSTTTKGSTGEIPGYISFPRIPDRPCGRIVIPATHGNASVPELPEKALAASAGGNFSTLHTGSKTSSPILPERLFESDSEGTDSPTIGRPAYLDKFLGINQRNASITDNSELSYKTGLREVSTGYGTIKSQNIASFGKPSRVLSYSERSSKRAISGTYDHYPKSYLSGGTLVPSGRRSFYDKYPRPVMSDVESQGVESNAAGESTETDLAQSKGVLQPGFGESSRGQPSLMQKFYDRVVALPEER